MPPDASTADRVAILQIEAARSDAQPPIALSGEFHSTLPVEFSKFRAKVKVRF
jgi:hypothetical protein